MRPPVAGHFFVLLEGGSSQAAYNGTEIVSYSEKRASFTFCICIGLDKMLRIHNIRVLL